MKTGYLIDMDGVIYRENQLIPGAADFVQAMNATGTPFLFLTNNSAPTPEDLAVRLNHLGIHGLSARHFYTSALNTADFLGETDPGCTVFVIGEGGLLAALHERKIANAKKPVPAPAPQRPFWKRAPVGARTTSASRTAICSTAPGASWLNWRRVSRSWR